MIKKIIQAVFLHIESVLKRINVSFKYDTENLLFEEILSCYSCLLFVGCCLGL